MDDFNDEESCNAHRRFIQTPQTIKNQRVRQRNDEHAYVAKVEEEEEELNEEEEEQEEEKESEEEAEEEEEKAKYLV